MDAGIWRTSRSWVTSIVPDMVQRWGVPNHSERSFGGDGG